MLLFRSLALGLLGACVMLIAMRPKYEIRFVREPQPVLQPSADPTATIIDVAPYVSGAQLASLIRLQSDEHIRAIDGTVVDGNSLIEAGAQLALVVPYKNRFVDLDVVGASSSRRVLVLLH